MSDAPRPEPAGTAALNPKTVEALARIVQEEHLRLFQSDLAQAIENARGTVARTDALHTARPEAPAGDALSREQTAELLVCGLANLIGLPRRPDPRLDEDGRLTQALGPALGSKGGYLVPEEFVQEVERRANEPAVVWPLVTKRPTNRDSVTKPEITAYPTVSKGADAKSKSTTTSDDVAETEPTIGQLTWTMRHFDARWLTKVDLLDDSPLNIMAELTEVVADAFAVEREREPIVGTGSDGERPLGLENAGLTEVAIGGALTLTNLLEFLAEIPQRYRPRATVLTPADTYFDLVKELATNVHSAQYLVEALPPIRESAYLTDGKIIGGDFSKYVVYHNRLMQVVTATVPRKFAVEAVIVEKWDGRPTQTDAFRIGTGVTYS